jgi:hypothetical protein
MSALSSNSRSVSDISAPIPAKTIKKFILLLGRVRAGKEIPDLETACGFFATNSNEKAGDRRNSLTAWRRVSTTVDAIEE